MGTKQPKHLRVPVQPGPGPRIPTVCNDIRAGHFCQLPVGHQGSHRDSTLSWEEPDYGKRPHGRPKGLGRHPKGCVTLTIGGERPTCCHLADGTKVVIKRSPEVKGSVYLAVEEQATIHPCVAEFEKIGEAALADAGAVQCQTFGDFIDGLKRIAKAVQDRLDAIEHGED